MTEFRVEVVRVGRVEKHPNADALSITQVHGGYPCVVRTGEFNEGDLAVYVPVDAIVPSDDPRWGFLGEHTRIKAKRLRGVFSMGLLTRAEAEWTEGQDVREAMRITKYDPMDAVAGADNEPDPGYMPVYTDIEGLRRWPGVLRDGEDVVVTEKIHGENARFVYADGRLWVGSRTGVKRFDPKNTWWQIAEHYSLEIRLRDFAPGIIIYGENYGGADLKYGADSRRRLVLFDAMDSKSRRYLDHDEFVALAENLDLPCVPVLHRGPWSDNVRAIAEGTTMLGGSHVREGFVVKPVRERFDERVGRVIFKLIGEGYLTRKGG